MKPTKLKYLITPIYIIVIAILILLGYSCSDMNELANRFLDKGEIIYAAKVDSASVGIGDRRILIELYIKTPRIETVRIYWNDGNDSLNIPVNGQVATFKQMIEGLNERNYIFNLVSLDKHGNKSLPYEVTGTAYGENYKNTLINRGIQSMQADMEGNKLINWVSVDTTRDARYTEIRYTNSADKEIILKTPIGDSKTVIADYKPGTKFDYRTVYIPDQKGVDTFYTDYRESISTYFPLVKSGWKIIDFSSEHIGDVNTVQNIIDGTGATRWQSGTLSDAPGYPHHVTIDLGGEITISQFGVSPTTYNQAEGSIDTRGPNKIQFLVSTDGNNWTDLGIFDFDRFKSGEQLYPVTPTRAKYYKFIGLSGPEKYIVLGELDIYCQ